MRRTKLFGGKISAKSKKLLAMLLALAIVVGMSTMLVAADEPLQKEPREAATLDVAKYVTNLCEVILGKKADEEGVKYWLNLMEVEGWTPETVTGTMLFSNEAVDKNWTNEEFVTVLYAALFEREPDAEGYENWVSLLAEGRARAWVLERFFDAPEWSEKILGS